MREQQIINWRNFILLSTALVSRSFINASAQKYKMGLQLFTVRGPLANDVAGTVKKIASIGYEDCETYGYHPDQVKYYGLKASVFKYFSRIIK